MNGRLERGQLVPPIVAESIAGTTVEVPSTGALVHLSFRRFAGCPVCNLHLRSIAKRHAELVAAGVREVALFHSSRAAMMRYQGDLPFDVIADPERAHYARYGVESSVRAVLDPRSWAAMARGMAAPHASHPLRGEGGHVGLPADFLVGAGGRLLAVKYGAHADDQWSVDEILCTARDLA